MAGPISVDEDEVTPVSSKPIAVDESEVTPVAKAAPLTVNESDVTPVAKPYTPPTLTLQERIGSLVPQSAMPLLSWFQKHINDPLDNMATAGANAGRELGRDMLGEGADPNVQKKFGIDKSTALDTALGVTGGVGSVAGGAVADPRNWPFLASGSARPILQKVISGGFAAQMGKGALDTAQSLHDNWDKLTPEQRSEGITKGGLSAAMALASAAHAATGGTPELSEPSAETDTASPQGVASAAVRAPIAVDEEEVSPVTPTSSAPLAVDEDEVSPLVAPGPGAQNLGTGVKEAGSDISQLGAAMKTGPKPNVADRMKAALGDARDAVQPEAIKDAVSGAVDSAKDAVTSRLDRVKAAGSAIWDSYANPPDWTDFKDSRGKWDYALQRSSHEAMQFAKDIKEGIPDAGDREAIVNYIQAGGDDAVLKQRSEASDGDLKEGYEAARNLTDEQKIKAQNISNYFDAKLEQARASGMLSAGVENYVNQIWDRPNPVTQKLQADVDYGTLRTNPSLLKQRIFGSYFDGEQAGFEPKNKDIGYLVTAYEEAFNKATAGRAFIKSMLDGSAKDGRPLLVANGDRASSITSPEGNVTANLISPKFIGDKFGDYQPIDHPALRKWTWIGKDSDGKPIYQNGDLWVHPDAYGELSNNLSNSKLRQIPQVKSLMDFSQKVKGSMLGYSLFHQVQEGVHAVGHKINPFDVGKILDFDAPDQRTLIEHGLQVSNARAQEVFMDGHEGAYAYRVPVVGRMAQRYSDYLFSDWIPNLKMKTGLDILKRNQKRFAGKYTADQIAEISAKQANAAYGELNYRQMGRNKTMQDVFRVAGLAPDFLEARGRFIAQALRPEGAEQRAALIRLTATLYGAARIMNMAMNSGNPRIDKPFSVTYKGKDYFLRSIPGDTAHLVSDPRSFIYTRLNPVTTKPLIEELTGRDEFGRKRSTGQHLWDTLKGWSPIAVQKWIKNPQDFSPLDSVLQSMGIASTKERTPKPSRRATPAK